MKDEIVQSLKTVLGDLGLDREPELSIPEDPKHGDYSTNIALVAAKELGKNPRELAKEIVQKFQVSSFKFQVEIAGPGFINFFVDQKSLITHMQSVLSGDGTEKTIQSDSLEYFENTQPNTNKPLHIGHLRNTGLGDAIVSLRRAIGKDAKSVNINNDRGIHIIKAMYGYLLFANDLELRTQDLGLPNWEGHIAAWLKDQSQWETPKSVGMKPDHFVGKYYVKGDQTEHGEFGEQFKEQENLMLIAWEDGDPRVRALWEMMNGWFYAGFRETHGRFLGISQGDQQFYKEWYESEIYVAGKQLVLDNMDKNLFVKSEDGAIIAKFDDSKLPDKVVIRKNGTSMYVTQDLELIRLRLQEDKATLVANVVADEQDLYFKQLYTICEKLGIAKPGQLKHVSYGVVNLKGGMKMSSRKGTAVQADELMDTVKENIKEAFKIADDELAEQVMIGAIKYWMLRYSPKAPISFAIEESVDLGGNSGPYLQYTYARTRSVLAKSQGSSFKPQENGHWALDIGHLSLDVEEELLLRKLVHYQDVIEEAAKTFAPNLLCNYLFELAQEFNLFYQKLPILKAEEKRDFRLALTDSVGMTIRSGLGILGIPVPEQM